MLDGFRKDYISKERTPFLFSLSKKFNLGDLEQPFGFTNITASFFTSNNIGKHKVFALYKKRKVPLKINPYSLIPNKNPIKNYLFNFILYLTGKNISAPCINPNLLKYFELSSKDFFYINGIKNFLTKKNFLIYEWPFVFYNLGKEIKKKLVVFDNEENGVKRFIKLSKKFKDKNFFYFHFSSTDSLAHSSGIESRKFKENLKKVDLLLKKICDNFNLKKDKFVLWSDHGMLEVKKFINLKKKLPKFGDGYIYFLDSTLARFWFFSEKKKQEVVSILKKIKEGHILTEKEIKKYQLESLKEEYGELFFLVNDGFLIFPNFFQEKKPAKAMHGYSLKSKEEKALFISNFIKQKKLEVVELSKKINSVT